MKYLEIRYEPPLREDMNTRLLDKSRLISYLLFVLRESSVRWIFSSSPWEEIQLWLFIQECLDHRIEVQVPRLLENGLKDSVILKELDKLIQASFGTCLPGQTIKAEHDPQIMICPGWVFTERGDRLGYGGTLRSFFGRKAWCLELSCLLSFSSKRFNQSG